MLRIDDHRLKLESNVSEAKSKIDKATNEQQRIHYTKELCSSYYQLGNYHLSLFNRAFNVADLQDAKENFDLAADASFTINQERSHLLEWSLLSVENQKKFHESNESTLYVRGVRAFYSTPRVPEEMAENQDGPNSDHAYEERPTKIARTITPKGYVDPVAIAEEELDGMDLEESDNTFNFRF